ncbi:MAG TPA: hypothetical protein VLF71_04595 [Candidatus Saccharimonadales bacterium]|nr:hypothetical protein [Candidatus Saccharimonadales bacterium]
MKLKNLGVFAAVLVAVIASLHFIPMYSKTVTACAARPLTKQRRLVLGATPSSIDTQANALQGFNQDIACHMDAVTFKLYVL